MNVARRIVLASCPVLVGRWVLSQVVVELELRNAADNRAHPDTPSQTSAACCDVNCRRHADEGAATTGTLDSHDLGCPMPSSPGVNLLGCVARIDGQSPNRHLGSALVSPALIKNCGEPRPDLLTRGIAINHPVLNKPGLSFPTPSPNRDLDAIFLHICTGSQKQPVPRNCPNFVIFAPVVEPLPVGCLTGFHPGLAEFRVLHRLDGRIRALSRQPGGRNLGPRAPTDRAVKAGNVKADCTTIIGEGRGGRPPFAVFQHPGLIVLLDVGLAVLTFIPCGLGPRFLPFELLELKPLPLST